MKVQTLCRYAINSCKRIQILQEGALPIGNRINLLRWSWWPSCRWHELPALLLPLKLDWSHGNREGCRIALSAFSCQLFSIVIISSSRNPIFSPPGRSRWTASVTQKRKSGNWKITGIFWLDRGQVCYHRKRPMDIKLVLLDDMRVIQITHGFVPEFEQILSRCFHSSLERCHGPSPCLSVLLRF